MKENKLNIKDLVTIGVFVVIYAFLTFCVGMIGLVPILFLAYPSVLGIVAGVVVMLFMAKVKKPWALFIFGIINPFLMFVLGHTYVIALHGLVIMFIAEMLRRVGKFSSFKYNMLAYAVFNTWTCGSMMQMLWAKEKYIKLSMMMGQDYVDAMERLITYKNMSIVYLLAILGGVIGAYLGKVLLKKHFIKAGIV